MEVFNATDDIFQGFEDFLGMLLIPDFVVVVVRFRVIAAATFLRSICAGTVKGSAIVICLSLVFILFPSVRKKTKREDAMALQCQ
jgi:hypothetical protein